jgi:putative colanic acid biosynthesis UDP-glucose lipid carrier transferase
MTHRKPTVGLTYIYFEFSVLTLCILLILILFKIHFFTPPPQLWTWEGLPFYLILIYSSWAAVVLLNGNPDFYFTYSFRKRLKHLLLNSLLMIGASFTLCTLFDVYFLIGPVILIPFFLFSFLNLFLFRFAYEFLMRGKYPGYASKILIVGSSQRSRQVSDFTKKIGKFRYDLVGYLSDEQLDLQMNGHKLLGRVGDLPYILDATPIDEIFIAGAAIGKEKMSHVIEEADFRGIRISVIPETLDVPMTSYDLGGFQVLRYRRTPLDNFNNFLLKRLFDFVFSATVLVVLSPLLLIISLLILLDGKGAILYRPHRKGEGGRTFKCNKFRTMSVCDDPVYGTKSTDSNDTRVTRIGKYLRKYDLDELPQFYNVLKGDMSVVGPRPHREFLQDDFRKIVNDYMVRHYVKPGITGWAQVNGWRGPTQTEEQKKQRIRHDIWYIENWSFLLDLKIIFLTVFGKKSRLNAF